MAFSFSGGIMGHAKEVERPDDDRVDAGNADNVDNVGYASDAATAGRPDDTADTASHGNHPNDLQAEEPGYGYGV
jgi:hypothetical protein